jgi:predicted dienelactone hydrolase
MGALLSGVGALPALSAERLTTYVGPLQVSVPIDALETYVEDGTASGDLGLILRFLDDDTENQFRQLLQHEVQMDAVVLSRVFNIPMAEQILQSVGNTLQTDSGLNGFYAVRSALILAAANHPDGWTLLDWMRQYPTHDIRIDLGAFLTAMREMQTIFLYQNAATQVVIEESRQEAAVDPALAYDQLPDLNEPGPYAFRTERLAFDIQSTRTTLNSFTGHYTLRVDMYVPEGITDPVPLVVYSHGWGGRLSDGAVSGEFLASHGFAVAVPEHIGTTDTYRSLFLVGGLGDVTSPVEYVNRPEDVIFMLDELEKLAETGSHWASQIDMQQVGLMGASFGGLTVLASAGASFNPANFSEECAQGFVQFNPSFLLQCHARFLPPTEYEFTDPRIKAALPMYPMGSTLYGPEGLANITIPMMMFAGSEDILAPSVYEQIPMFSWMESPDRYLAFFAPGNHFSTSSPSNVARIPAPLRGPDASIGRYYLNNLSVAFFKTYLSDSPDTSDYLPYLTSSYAQSISRDEMGLYLIRSLTPDQLAVAYGGTAPGSDRPQHLAALPDNAEAYDSVLDDLKETGVLRVGIRSEAAPFGYINQQAEWTGFCFDMAKQLVQYLADEESITVDLIAFPSNLENRFDLVREGTVHLECGPNTIRADVDDVAFSEPFYTAALKLLTTAAGASGVNLEAGLVDLKTGVLDNTATEQFIRNQYPQTEVVPFETVFGREDAIQALEDNMIDVFASDAILSVGEILRQGQSLDNFALVPDIPLSCEFYGLVVPEGDRPWRTVVNSYLRSEAARLQRREFAGVLGEESVANLEFCFR